MTAGVRAYDAYFDTVGVDASGAEKSRDKAVGVLTPRLSADLVRSVAVDGSSTSFSALGVLFFRGLILFSAR